MRTSSSASGLSDSCIRYPEPRFGIRLEGFVIRGSSSPYPEPRYGERSARFVYPRILIPLTRTLSRDSWCVARGYGEGIQGYGIRDTGYGEAQLFSLKRCGGCGCYFGSSAAARVCGVYINSKRSKKTAPAEEAVLRTSRTSRSFL